MNEFTKVVNKKKEKIKEDKCQYKNCKEKFYTYHKNIKLCKKHANYCFDLIKQYQKYKMYKHTDDLKCKLKHIKKLSKEEIYEIIKDYKNKLSIINIQIEFRTKYNNECIIDPDKGHIEIIYNLIDIKNKCDNVLNILLKNL